MMKFTLGLGLAGGLLTEGTKSQFSFAGESLVFRDAEGTPETD